MARPKAGAPAEKPQRKRSKRKRAAAAEVARQERIAEALDYRRQGFTYRQIAEAMGIAPATAYELVKEGLSAIILEPAESVRKMVLDRYDEMLQRLMPLLEDGAPVDVIDRILKINDKILALHGLAGGINVNLPGGSIEGGEDGDAEAIIIQRIKATAPVLRPDVPGPANPIL